MKTYSFHDVAVFIHDHPDTPACKEFLEATDEDETITDNLVYFFSEARVSTFTELADRGLIIDRELQTVVIRDIAALDSADELLAEITSDYEGETNHGWWEILGLGGDDDVDYNGGYLMSNLDVIRAMLEADVPSSEA